MEAFLEIMKFTIPGLVVFAAVYFLFQQNFEENNRTRNLSLLQDKQKIVLPMRLQAYERFTLFCERVAISNVLLRLRQPEMSVRDLKTVLLLGIQQEFEHNVAQQIYVSDTLWKIIRMSKEETLNLVLTSAEGLPADADAQILVDSIFQNLEKIGGASPVERALPAIRTEAAALFG